MYPVDFLNRRAERFVLWLPGITLPSPPEIVLRILYQDSSSNDVVRQALLLTQLPDLWELDPKAISPPLQDGVYHYWFLVGDLLVTDPWAFTVDYTPVDDRLNDDQPPGVIKYRDGKLWECDVGGKEPKPLPVPAIEKLPANNHLVIYELPTSWAKAGTDGRGVDVDVGTFEDVRALFDRQAHGRHFADVPVIRNEAILSDLGINALELLPAADAKTLDAWGYATAHYFSPDYDLGTASELRAMVRRINGNGVRFFTDVVMAFGHDSYSVMDFEQFHINANDEPANPDAYQSHAQNQKRNGWGGSLWRYIKTTETYDPETGTKTAVHPSWAFQKSHLTRWMADFGVCGLRLDSINNVGNWDFVRAYKEKAWELFNARYGVKADPSKFLVIGEELSMPVEMIHQGCLNALWNEPWQYRLRAVLLGESLNDNFEWTVRKLVDCTLDNLSPNFTDGSQAINYITSHDTEGTRKERLFDFLTNANVWDVERRAKLAFALLLTSVGIPMIFAGEEFADAQDQSRRPQDGRKQEDPVNYARKNDGGWRQALFAYNAALVRFRIACPALGTDDTDFFHVDAGRGGRIMAWRRGAVGRGPVVVVANFSDEDTPGAEYVVPDWPEREHEGWREVTQGRAVPAEWVGREPLMAWEAKVYTYWSP